MFARMPEPDQGYSQGTLGDLSLGDSKEPKDPEFVCLSELER